MVCLINLREKKCTELTKEDGKPDAQMWTKKEVWASTWFVQKYGQGKEAPNTPPEPSQK
jgi:hypothetical protein